MLLSELKIGEEKRVKEINCPDKIKLRLNNMGLTVGTKVTLVRVAVFGDPLEIKVRDFYMAIRIKEAYNIVVEDL